MTPAATAAPSARIDAPSAPYERPGAAALLDAARALSAALRQASPAAGRRARLWLRDADRALPALTPTEALEVIVNYDTIHSLANGRPAPRATLDRYILAAFEARIHGDTTVNPDTLLTAITDQLHRRNPAFLDRPLRWAASRLHPRN